MKLEQRASVQASSAENPSAEALVFRPSANTTLGVELELQIIDPHTRDLASGAVRVLQACEADGLEGVTAELMQSMIEVKTGICQNVTEVRDQFLPLLRRIRNLTHSLGYRLAWGGTHPFNRGLTGVVSPEERYEKIRDRLAWLTYQRMVFGLHVHVGMPSGDMAIGVINMLVRYIPHLVAISASSPFWHGEDTGLASCRTALYRMLPHAGVPRYFRNWKEYRTFCRVMHDTQAIRSPKDIYWDIRPCPGLGTIEFRMCDMPMNLATTLGIVAFIRCLVISTQRLLEERPHLCRGDIRRHWIAIENKWLATRYGLEAMHIRTPSGKRRRLAQEVTDTIERLLPIAKEVGDAPFLRAVRPGESFETGADRQRRLFRDHGDWKALVEDMEQQWEKEL